MNPEQLSQLLKNQQEIGKTITYLHERLGKENRSRRNKLQRLLEWRGKFNDEWSKFLDNHDQLKDASEQLKDENYFKQDYYNFVKVYYQDGITKIALQEQLQKRKEGLPTIPEEPPESEQQANENEKIETEEQQEDDELELGFVTSIGEAFQNMDHLPGHSTPKRESFIVPQKIDKFLTLEKVLMRKIDEIEKLSKTGLKTRARIILNDIEKIWNNFHAEMEKVCSASDDYEDDYYETYQHVANRYYQVLEEVGEPLNKNPHRQLPERHENTQVKVEPLKIPKFRGTYESWPTFSSLFDTVIIANRSLTDVQRMQYLKSVVTDEAERAIASLNITGENFEIAWKILTERFDNKRAIIDNQIIKAFELEKVHGNSAQHLRKFHDQSKECYALLKEVPGEQYLLHILKGKMDNFSRSLYQQQIEDNAENENIEAFFAFLHKRCRVLESMEFKQVHHRDEKKPNNKQQNFKNREQVCSCCGKNHAIYFCEKFKAMKVNERSEMVKSKSLCVLCLRPNHKSTECTYKSMCPTCSKRHNGLLHFERNNDNKNVKKAFVAVTANEEQIHDSQASAYTVGASSNKTNTLLATALVRLKTTYGWSEVFRVLIDQGSMLTFITERAVKLINLKQKNNRIDICGIAGSVEPAKGTVDLEITARYPTSFSAKATAVVLNKLTTLLPHNDFDRSLIKDGRINDLILADPHFNRCGKIDLILGADIYSEIIMHGMIKAEDNSFVAQETEIGWMISGPIGKKNSKLEQAVCMVATMSDIDKKLQKFWEIEDISEQRDLSEEEKMCVKHFETTIQRGTDGVYSVSLPFKKDAPSLGDSRKMAVAQFFQLERKLERDPSLKKLYSDYIDEMLKRGYLRKCDSNNVKQAYYLPHHPVFKKSVTTKVRPVFNASVKSSNGISLNDILITGPRLQEELFNILVRFRKHKVAFSADIEKMYLHVNLDEKDLDFQRIIYRKNPTDPLEEYHLTTVTFGINCSPYLAVATVQHHAKKESVHCPEACEIITDDSYMDDVSSGCPDDEKAIKIQKEVTQTLAKAGFPLRKWISNSNALMEQIPSIEKGGVSIETRNGYDKYVTTLGVPWFFESDKIGFKCEIDKCSSKLTKRTVLSELLSVFDPLGLLSPITIYNKILMQNIWKSKIDWDDEVDIETKNKWMEFREQLPIIEKLQAPRWLNSSPGDRIELIGFSDASEAAIGACVYLKSYGKDDINVTLVASKTKVAPVKKITLPRLELCAAELLTKLMKTIKTALKLEPDAVHYYSDSKIALAWIQSDPGRWKTFVANRVSRIQNLSKPENWHYINTKANPADFASRGLLPIQLVDNKLWWNGPSVLMNDETYQHDGFETNEEEKRIKQSTFHAGLNTSIFDKFSSFYRAVRTMAVCQRFKNELKSKKGLVSVLQKSELEKEYKNFVLSTDELEFAKFTIISMYQEKYFHDDLCALKEKHELTKKSRLHGLYPFMDNAGVLRVGGRLQNSDFSYNKKHPIIIPYGCKLMDLIIDFAHKKTLHGGNQLTLAEIRHEYWIVGAKRAVKKYINNCVICHRFKKSDSSQLMGSLPMARTKLVPKAFTNTGVDLCGPLYLKMMKARGVTTQKGYIVIFICLSTRAIHIEMVTDLTAEAFIASFKRFIGRRGNVAHLYSDNGTNFIGANTILNLEGEQAMKEYNDNIRCELAKLNTKFHFNPSLSPWMGGIWERGVGSIKHHLKRTIKDRILSYEQLQTLLIQIEAILNSRPISPLNENPDDLEILTPGHFLVGTALTTPVEPNLMQLRENRLSDWQLCVRLKQEFWAKWSNDYISQLQIRSKWKNTQNNLSVGDMVLVKEDNTAPLHWPLARVTRVFPGRDNLVRVVEVRMRGKILKRPIVRLAPLPLKTHNLEEEIDTASKNNDENTNETSTQGISCHLAIIGVTMEESTLESIDPSSLETVDLTNLNSEKEAQKSQTTDFWNENSHKGQSTIIHISNEIGTQINANEFSHGKERKRKMDSSEIEPARKKLKKYHAAHELDIISTMEKNNEKPLKFKRKTISLCTLGIIGFFFLLFGYLFTPIAANYTNIQFDPHTTAYIEPCNNVTEITGYWNLAVHRNVDNFYHDVDTLHASVNHLKSFCKKEANNSICSQVLNFFEQKLTDITMNEQIIRNEMNVRDRRGLGLLALGSALGATGAIIYNWITKSQEDAFQTELLDQHTSIIGLMEQDLMEVDEKLQTTQNQNTEIWATAWLLAAFNTVTDSQNRIMEKITKFTMTIDPQEIPLNLLMQNVKLISKSLRKNEQLAGRTTLEKSLNIYKLATLKQITVIKNSIIAIIKIPLVADTSFECKKLIPLPVKRAKSNEIITIQGEYVLSHRETSNYCIKTKAEMKKCLLLDEVTFCEMERKIEANASVCEINMASNKSDGNCQTAEYNSDEFLRKIQTATWLYSLSNANISILCSNSTYNETLNGAGILKVDANCTLSINKILLHELENESSDMFINTSEWHTIHIEAAGQHNTLKRMHAEISDLKRTQSTHHWLHAHHALLLYAFIVWIIICFTIVLVRNRQSKIKHPIITLKH